MAQEAAQADLLLVEAQEVPVRRDYRITQVNSKNEEVTVFDHPRAWGARRIFEGAKLPRGHTIRLYRKSRFSKKLRLIAERGKGPRIGPR